METRTRIVLLMHPKEFAHQKCTTGRLTCLNLGNSEIIQGINFDDDARFRSLIDDPLNYPVLLYPGERAMSLSRGQLPASAVGHRRLVVFLIDATWHCSRTSRGTARPSWASPACHRTCRTQPVPYQAPAPTLVPFHDRGGA